MFTLEILEECGSTNDELLARRADSRFHGLALLALRQTNGHGRRGNQWWSGEGNLALSVGFRLTTPPSLLPFRAGLALYDTFREFLPSGPDLRLKWPNDLYLDGRKVAGLIAQVRQAGEGADLVLGIGANLRVAPPDLEATALSHYAPAPAPAEFAEALLPRLEIRWRQEEESVRLDWEKAARIQGAALRVLGEEGEYWGRALLPSGELEVESRSGHARRLASETVSLRFR